MTRKNQFDISFLKIAKEFSTLSRAKKAQVGAIIVKDGNILSCGFNGTPSGCDNECEDMLGKTKPVVIHAEQNCLIKLSKSNISSDNSTCYTTTSPCLQCAILLYQAGIKRVVYSEVYRITDGIQFLIDNRVLVDRIEL